jgi:hypothetical protein
VTVDLGKVAEPQTPTGEPGVNARTLAREAPILLRRAMIAAELNVAAYCGLQGFAEMSGVEVVAWTSIRGVEMYLVTHDKRSLWFIVPGTDDAWDMGRNLLSQVPFPTGDGMVSLGFLLGARHAEDWLEEQKQTIDGVGLPIYATGHSQGAAILALTMRWLRAKPLGAKITEGHALGLPGVALGKMLSDDPELHGWVMVDDNIRWLPFGFRRTGVLHMIGQWDKQWDDHRARHYVAEFKRLIAQEEARGAAAGEQEGHRGTGRSSELPSTLRGLGGLRATGTEPLGPGVDARERGADAPAVAADGGRAADVDHGDGSRADPAEDAGGCRGQVPGIA